ncbi:MAG TPA: ComEC/Rec2 family competence protein [Patescibacteria group bacterium]|nr:ComEC/Rec2 family competence protein [Patescibacteria group bacterium]
MTRSGWLAVGAVVAALLTPGPGALITALAAAGAALGLAVATRRPTRGTSGWIARLRHGLPIALGALGLAMRVIVGGLDGAEPAASLPDGRGPWLAAVEARSANRDGQQVAMVRVQGDGASWLIAATLPRFPDVEPGDLLTIDGAIRPPPDGPYGTYLSRIGVAGTIRSRGLSVTGELDGPGATLERLRRAAGDALARSIPEPEAGLAAGIVIGLRDRVDRELAADFTTVGASHVVAISGWNIAIVAATVAALAGRLGRRRRTMVMIPAILLYVLFAGASASVVRAAAMAGVVLLARETGRAGRAAAALGWAAAILLIVEPALVLDAGFQLSTLATAGILAWADPLARRLRSVAGGRLPGWLAKSLAVSLAAQAVTLPIVLVTFGRLAIISPAINLAIVPLVAPAMAAALVALLGGVVALAGGPGLVATLAGLPAWGLLTLVCTIVRAGAALPFANLGLEPPWTVIAAAAVIGLPLGAVVARGRLRRLRRVRGRPAAAAAGPTTPARATKTTGHRPHPPRQQGRLAVVALAVAVATLGLAAAHRTQGIARITVLDVGQGDAILVEGGGGGRMLIDGGPDPDRLLVELDRRLPPWDRRIDILVLTHPHEDHVAGLPLLLERYRIGQVFESGMRGRGPGYAAFARDLAADRARPLGTLATGARIALDDIRLRVLWPDPGRVPLEPPNAGRAINDVSIVLLGEVAGRRFLLTGDVEDDVDPVLARRGLPSVDILKVAHHGSGTATTPAFLDAVRPRIAVVSSGADNPYGHPARSTIERVTATAARVLRTDTDGSVTLTIDPAGTIRVATSGARAAARLLVPGPRMASAAAGTGAGPDAPPPLPIPAVAFGCGIPSGG